MSDVSPASYATRDVRASILKIKMKYTEREYQG
jgi:hypothetical protein